MNEHFASGLTNEQLKAEILRQGRKANLRLSQLKKSGMYEKNPIIYMEVQRLAQLRQEEQREFALCDFKTYFKTTVI